MAEPSLAGLQELPLPAPPSWMPQTIGWLGVAIVVVAVAAWVSWRRRRRWLADAYRRQARAELARIERGDVPATVLPTLVKRTVLAFAPRETVARLSDAEWLGFLDRTYPPGGFSDGPGRLLPLLAYAADAPDPQQVRDVVALVARWIDGHQR